MNSFASIYSRYCALALVLPLAMGTRVVMAQAADSTTAALKNLSLDQLMDVEVTSVSRHPEKLLQSASAIQVITREDIRRSGATSIAEALRLADMPPYLPAAAVSIEIRLPVIAFSAAVLRQGMGATP